jgi:hypothetical protein
MNQDGKEIILRTVQELIDGKIEWGEKNLPKWEYAVIPLVTGREDVGVSTQEELLDKYGLEGWELVSVATVAVPRGLEMVAYLKRQKS